MIKSTITLFTIFLATTCNLFADLKETLSSNHEYFTKIAGKSWTVTKDEKNSKIVFTSKFDVVCFHMLGRNSMPPSFDRKLKIKNLKKEGEPQKYTIELIYKKAISKEALKAQIKKKVELYFAKPDGTKSGFDEVNRAYNKVVIPNYFYENSYMVFRESTVELESVYAGVLPVNAVEKIGALRAIIDSSFGSSLVLGVR